jgi:membrane fusion protein, multidrug efflux system
MDIDTTTDSRKLLRRLISIGIAIAALAIGLMVLHNTNYYPRTDDAEVVANFIGIAPQVDSRMTPAECARQPVPQEGRVAV